MITLIIRNKMFSISGRSAVQDEAGTDRFIVNGAVFSFTRRKEVLDMQGNLLYVIKNKFINFITRSCYIYDAAGNMVARLSNRIRFFSHAFTLYGYTDDIQIEGDIIQHEMNIMRNGEKIGTVGKKFFSLVDSYTLTAYNDEDAPFLVALIIALDNINDNRS